MSLDANKSGTGDTNRDNNGHEIIDLNKGKHVEIWDGANLADLREKTANLPITCSSLAIEMEGVKSPPQGFYGLLNCQSDLGRAVLLSNPTEEVRTLTWFRMNFVFSDGFYKLKECKEAPISDEDMC